MGRELEGGALNLPFAKGAFAVFGEIPIVDRLGVEVGFDKGLGLRERIEPGEYGTGGFAIGEAEVDLFADLGWETGDFAGHSKMVSGLVS